MLKFDSLYATVNVNETKNLHFRCMILKRSTGPKLHNHNKVVNFPTKNMKNSISGVEKKNELAAEKNSSNHKNPRQEIYKPPRVNKNRQPIETTTLAFISQIKEEEETNHLCQGC